MKVKSDEEILAVCRAVGDKMGVKTVEVQFKQGKNPSLTVFIDKDGGVDLDCCEAYHNAIDAPLDQLDPTFGMPYTLNVSSLGIDRPFKTEEDFISHIGKRIEVKLANSVKGKKFYDGILISYDGKNASVKVNDKFTFTVDMKNVVKMNEYIDFE